MKKYLKYLIFLSLLFPSLCLGAGTITVDNIVVGSGASNAGSGASVYINADTISGTTPIAVVSGGIAYFSVYDGYVRKKKSRHVYGGFQGLNETISVSGASVWATIANIWTGLEVDGVTLDSGTTIEFTESADFFGMLAISFSGLNGKDFAFRVYDVTDGATEGYVIGASTTGLGNYIAVPIPLYIEADAGDKYVMQVTCETDGSDPVLKSAIFYLIYLHE